jgi:DNA-binding NtrC family response regulator
MRVGVIADRAISPNDVAPAQREIVLGLDTSNASGYVAVLLDGPKSLKEKIEAVEAQLVLAVLQRHRWNQSKTAAELGLSRPGLANKIKRYRLRERDFARHLEATRAAEQRGR